jgi:hypothetical protein
MYYSYVEIEYVSMSFSFARMDLAVKLLMDGINWTELMDGIDGNGWHSLIDGINRQH